MRQKVKNILITQPRPENARNPYFELAKKYNLHIDFRSFIYVKGVAVKELRKENINFSDFSAIIFTSRNAVDQYFRVCMEMRYVVPGDLKYFCNAESTALYLQKYIQYRKRKVFFPKKNNGNLMEVIKKYSTEKFLFPCSDINRDNLAEEMKKLGYSIKDVVMYKIICSDLSDLNKSHYDMIAFFSPFGIKSLLQNFPDFQQNDIRIAAFGGSTHKAAIEAGLDLHVCAPTEQTPSLTMAIEEYIKSYNNP